MRTRVHRGVPVAVGVVVLLVIATAHSETLIRGPYLQQGTSTSMIVRWRSDQQTDSIVRYGAAPGTLSFSGSSAALTTEHEITLTGLLPGTVYYYSVGSTGGPIAGDDSEHFFRTSPVPGTIQDTRIWVLGDSGTGNINNNSAAVRDAFLAFTGTRTANLLLMLGDNAYEDGTDAEYQTAMFDIYPQVLRQTPVWPTLGNHDGHTANASSQTGPYYDIFTLPSQAQAGGLASGTESYYSFDYGNVHFICLESHQSDRSPGGAMLTWLANDISATLQTWIIAFWHHPPYSMGSHNSDNESVLTQMRENVVPILEGHGVDLVLTGHSHSYERSFLIDGHYGVSDTFGPANQIDAGDGREDSVGAYVKLGGSGAPNAGAVYAVAGSSGKTGGGPLNHDAMFISLNRLGSLVVDINGNRLDAYFVTDTGAIDDYFTITKGPLATPPQLDSATALDISVVELTFNESVDALTAGDAGNYTLDSGASVAIAAPQSDGHSVRLITSPLLAGAPYVLTVNNVTDELGNVIDADSQIGFFALDFQTVVFQNGVAPDAAYDGMRDAWLEESQPSANNGASPLLLVDGNNGQGTDLSTLLAWDLSAIPAESLVQSVELVIDVFDPSSEGYGIHEIKRDWQENEATWTSYAEGMNWQAGGAKGAADRDTDPLATVTATAVGPFEANLNSDGVALVQAWIDGSKPNYGVILANDVPDNGIDFRSSEYFAATSRPKLVVTYAFQVDRDGDGIPNDADNCSSAANSDQRDTNGDGYGNLCDADLNNDGIVNVLDLGQMELVFFDVGDSDADLDGDGIINAVDLGLLKRALYHPPGPSGLVN